MKIKFLGTAAAEGMPALFCSCVACNKARILGGKNIRTRFQILIDDDTLIDFPPDSLYHMLKYNLDFTKITNLFISHQHQDHFDPKEISLRSTMYTNIRNNNFKVNGNKFVINETEKCFYPKNDTNMVLLNKLSKGDYIDIKNYNVYALEADHVTPDFEPLMYFFNEKKSNKNILFAHDTGYFKDSVWEFLKGKKLDLLSIDCTFVQMHCMNNHLGIDEIKILIDDLKRENIVTDDTLIIVNHFSHNALKLHEDIEELVKDYGWIVAYDGMEVEV